MYYLALPLIVMTFASLGGMTRCVRAAMTIPCPWTMSEPLGQKVSGKAVIYSHAWRNAPACQITVVIGWFLSIFSGSAVIENTFSINGMGKLPRTDGLNNNDYELVLAMQMFYTIVSLVGMSLIDRAMAC